MCTQAEYDVKATVRLSSMLAQKSCGAENNARFYTRASRILRLYYSKETPSQILVGFVKAILSRAYLNFILILVGFWVYLSLKFMLCYTRGAGYFFIGTKMLLKRYEGH